VIVNVTQSPGFEGFGEEVMVVVVAWCTLTPIAAEPLDQNAASPR
jgi:hypothetical protein